MNVSETILALDLGKYKSVACVYDRGSAQARFDGIPTSRRELEQFIDRHQPRVVVIEACTLAGWVHDLCAERGMPCKVANTASESWKFKHVKRKTDKDDALRLAQLESLNQLPTTVIPAKAIREWRALIAYRQSLVSRRVSAQNRIRAVLVSQGLPAPRGHRAWTEVGLQGIEQHAKVLADCAPSELWRGVLQLVLTDYRQASELIETVETKLNILAQQSEGVRILESIPGVGPRTAEVVTAYLDQANRFKTGKQVSAYAGMVPRQFQSGELDRRGRITRRGPALLRKRLVECAWLMLRYNPWARSIYQRLNRGKARKKQAIVAVARKLLVRCWAMLRDRTVWRGDPAPESPTTPA